MNKSLIGILFYCSIVIFLIIEFRYVDDLHIVYDVNDLCDRYVYMNIKEVFNPFFYDFDF
jgi:hypothetical protein